MRWELAIAVLVASVLCAWPHHDGDAPGYAPVPVAGSSPGPLTLGHAELDDPTHCDDCHDGSPATSSAKCLGCHAHDQLRGRIAAGEGFHASAQVRGTPCAMCHHDHKGRAYDPMGWAAFDHGDTAMPLTGAHRNVACAKCHPNNVFSLGVAKPGACDNAGCHRNAHTGHLFGVRDCAWCHSPAMPSMKQIHFDHESRLAIGRHDKLACYDCHTKARGEQKADMQCERCHAATGHHGNRFQAFGKPARCGVCHPATGWSASAFNHSANTKFALRGHYTLACRACHRGSRPDDFEDFHGVVACKDCHAHRTVHADADHPKGKYTTDQCLNCHMIESLPPRRRGEINVVHGVQGTFPLTRGHKAVPCVDCHAARSPAGKMNFTGLSPACAPTCHEDVLHRGSLGAQCQGCHVPGIWDAVAFDHERPFPAGASGKVASFPLRGLHRNAACVSCHPARDYAAAGATCASSDCHGSDDAHRGHLGNDCERCHAETGDIRFDHTKSSFPLDGKHRDVPCGDCHLSITFKPRPRDCAGCHPVPAFHRNGRSDLAWYNNNCGGCHTARGW